MTPADTAAAIRLIEAAHGEPGHRCSDGSPDCLRAARERGAMTRLAWATDRHRPDDCRSICCRSEP